MSREETRGFGLTWWQTLHMERQGTLPEAPAFSLGPMDLRPTRIKADKCSRVEATEKGWWVPGADWWGTPLPHSLHRQEQPRGPAHRQEPTPGLSNLSLL